MRAEREQRIRVNEELIHLVYEIEWNAHSIWGEKKTEKKLNSGTFSWEKGLLYVKFESLNLFGSLWKKEEEEKFVS